MPTRSTADVKREINERLNNMSGDELAHFHRMICGRYLSHIGDDIFENDDDQQKWDKKANDLADLYNLGGESRKSAIAEFVKIVPSKQEYGGKHPLTIAVERVWRDRDMRNAWTAFILECARQIRDMRMKAKQPPASDNQRL